MGLVLLIDVCY